MKRIHFDTIRNWIWIVIVVLSVVFILSGTFEIFEFENPEINKRISFVGFLLQVIYVTRVFWYKNYVLWNKRGAIIRINSFMNKSLNFDQIKTSELDEKKLILTKYNGSKVTFDMNNIAESDTHQLNNLILKHVSNTIH